MTAEMYAVKRAIARAGIVKDMKVPEAWLKTPPAANYVRNSETGELFFVPAGMRLCQGSLYRPPWAWYRQPKDEGGVPIRAARVIGEYPEEYCLRNDHEPECCEACGVITHRAPKATASGHSVR